MKPDAQALLRTDKVEFDRIYGQYYVASARRIAVLLIAVRISAKTLDETEKFVNKIRLGIKSIASGRSLDVSATVGLTKAAHESGVVCHFDQQYYGFQGNGPSIDSFKDIPGVLKWFREDANFRGVPVSYLLKHYSNLDDNACRDTDLSPESVLPVMELRNRMDSLDRRLSARPVPSSYAPQAENVVSTCCKSQPTDD